MLGAKPVIVDIEANSFNIDIGEVKKNINDSTKAIIVPHIFGFPAKIDEIISLKIPIIEDCAQSIGGEYKGKLLGSFGAISIFSFYASKMICGGDGGMILTDNKIYKETILNYRYYGHKKLHSYVAYNYHMTNLPAALAMSQLNNIKSFIDIRKEIALLYDNYFTERQDIKIDFENKSDACYYRYPVRLKKDINLVKKRMLDHGIICGYGVLEGMHQMLKLPTDNFTNTEYNLKSILSLPIYPSLNNDEITYIADTLIKVLMDI